VSPWEGVVLEYA